MSDIYERLLPVMREHSEIMEDYLGGILKTMRPSTQEDLDGLREPRQSVKGFRRAMTGYLQAISGNKRAMVRPRRQNCSASINESATQLLGTLEGMRPGP